MIIAWPRSSCGAALEGDVGGGAVAELEPDVAVEVVVTTLDEVGGLLTAPGVPTIRDRRPGMLLSPETVMSSETGLVTPTSSSSAGPVLTMVRISVAVLPDA